MPNIPGTPGNDTLAGTTGSDQFTPLGGNDTITGGGGFDTLDYTASPAGITVNLATGVAQDGYGGTDQFTGISSVLGSAFADTLTGAVPVSYNLRLEGRAGNDTIVGVSTTNGILAAYATSPAGIVANLATGRVQDGWGNTDILVNIFGIQGSAFADTIAGGSGNDRFRVSAGGDTYDGGAGLNRLDYFSSPAAVTVDMAAGTAQSGFGTTDRFANIQQVNGSQFDDTLLGSAGDDVFGPVEGSDTVDGRDGYDTVFYDAFATNPYTTGITGNLTTGIVTDSSGGTDRLLNIEALYGTTFSDDLTGVALGSTLSNLRGLQGNDTLRAPVPGTRIAADYRADPAAVTVNLTTGRATDGWGGTDTLANISATRGSAFNDSLTGSAANDYLRGEAGDDSIFGLAGDDFLTGDAGNDLLDGGAGFDTVNSSGNAFRDRGALARAGNGDLLQTRGAQLDTWRNIEQVSFLDGRLVLDAADPAARVARLYQAALNRAPDQGGLNFWTSQLQGGVSLDALSTLFLGSTEFTDRFGALDNGGYVDRLYVNVLAREGEPSGRAFWVGVLDNGGSRAAVLSGFSESPENKGRTAGLLATGIWDRDETAAQVARLYDTVFRRLPDIAGLTSWKAALTAGSTLPQVTDAFVGSTEFQGTYGSLDERAFVNTLYINSLGRTADPAGSDYWAGQLASGALGRSAVVLAFSESAEHIGNSAVNVGGEAADTYGIRFA